MKLNIKQPTQIINYKTSDNKQFSSKEEALDYEYKLSLKEWYYPIRIPYEGSHIEFEKIFNFITKHKKDILQLYDYLEKSSSSPIKNSKSINPE